MKSRAFQILVFTLISFHLSAQDTIYRRDQTAIRAKVISVNESDIEYRKYDDQSGITRSIPVNEVEKIKFEDGHVQKIKSLKQKEIFIDKAKLWDNNVSSSSNLPKDGKAKIEKIIFTIGIREQALKCKGVSLPNSMSAWGGGVGLAFPIKKIGDGDTTKSMLSLTYKLNILSGSKDLQNTYPEFLDPDQFYLYSESYRSYLIQNYITMDYRFKVSKRSFIAPSIGLTLDVSDYKYTADYLYIDPLSTGEVLEIKGSEEPDSNFKLGLIIGFDFVFAPIGIEVKYDQPVSGLLFGFNFAF